METDAVGGAGRAIACEAGRPDVFAGNGQGYEDRVRFGPNWLLDQLFE